MRLTCMRGYPGSGKSTAAREMASRTGASIVCRDTIRHTMFGRYTNVDEAAVTSMELSQVTNLLSLGKDVIVDAMHLNPRYLCKWATVAAEYSADWDVYDVLTEPAECIVNDADIDRARSGKRVGHEVITKLAARWPMNEWPVIESRTMKMEPYEPPKGKPFAVIVDVDGTLAHMTGRSPYDFSKVHTDEVDPCIRSVVNHYCRSMGADMLVVSGREDTCREQTEKWLTDNDIHYDELFMRKAKDNRKDSIIKYELFNDHIRDEYRVLLVLDDRNQVVKMWRELGVKCLQVQDGDF